MVAGVVCVFVCTCICVCRWFMLSHAFLFCSCLKTPVHVIQQGFRCARQRSDASIGAGNLPHYIFNEKENENSKC